MSAKNCATHLCTKEFGTFSSRFLSCTQSFPTLCIHTVSYPLKYSFYFTLKCLYIGTTCWENRLTTCFLHNGCDFSTDRASNIYIAPPNCSTMASISSWSSSPSYRRNVSCGAPRDHLFFSPFLPYHHHQFGSHLL